MCHQFRKFIAVLVIRFPAREERSVMTEPAAPRATRISDVRIALIAGTAALAVVLIFIIQNAHAVTISFLGAHLRLSLAVALLLAVICGALIMAAAGTARITQLRRTIRRGRRQPKAG
jgi:uncharacterized integral membrane protein